MKKYWIIIAGIIVIASGCRKTLDVNKNPNDPADVTIKELLPAAQVSIGQVYGNYLQVVGGIWSQYWTQSPVASQYRPLEQYQPGPSTANTAWQELYAGALTDLEKIAEKAGTAENTRNYTAIAKILQGYTFQLLTDNFGDVPFSEALKGVEGGITSPAYDRQQDIYAGIISLVKEGRDLIVESAAAPGSDDVIFHGDMNAWGQFANTLLLRMYLRMVYVSPGTALAGIGEVQGNSFGFLSSTAGIAYSSNPGNAYPLYSEMVNLSLTQNLIASATSTDSLVARGDPRLFAFYTGGIGLAQGYYSIPNPGVYSTPSALVGARGIDPSSALAQVKLLSSYESMFLQAEAAARTGNPTIAQELYENAIRANYEEYGLTDAESQDYLETVYLVDIAPYPVAGSVEEQVKAIITEKWYAMNGNQGIEAWTEWRRTGYPDFFTISRTSRIGNVFPVRLPYPETELTRNQSFPGQKSVTEKVWWDIN